MLNENYDFDFDVARDDDGYEQEEPDCFDCMQARTVRGRWWTLRRPRPCPGCCGGDWWDRLTRPVRAPRRRLSWWWHSIRFHRAPGPCPRGCDDEAPF